MKSNIPPALPEPFHLSVQAKRGPFNTMLTVLGPLDGNATEAELCLFEVFADSADALPDGQFVQIRIARRGHDGREGRVVADAVDHECDESDDGHEDGDYDADAVGDQELGGVVLVDVGRVVDARVDFDGCRDEFVAGVELAYVA